MPLSIIFLHFQNTLLLRSFDSSFKISLSREEPQKMVHLCLFLLWLFWCPTIEMKQSIIKEENLHLLAFRRKNLNSMFLVSIEEKIKLLSVGVGVGVGVVCRTRSF